MPHNNSERREHAPLGLGLLVGLTPEQAKALTYGTGPLLLIAGPGAGKTETLTHRMRTCLSPGGRGPNRSWRDVQRPRRRRAATAACRSARPGSSAPGHRGDVPLRVREPAARAHADCLGRTEKSMIYDPSDIRRVVNRIVASRVLRDLRSRCRAERCLRLPRR